MPDDQLTASVDLMHDMIQMYVDRNDEEIEKLKSQVRPGRPKPNKLLNLEMLKGTDQHEYNTGMSM
jgi:translation machinery-associated protein 16